MPYDPWSPQGQLNPYTDDEPPVLPGDDGSDPMQGPEKNPMAAPPPTDIVAEQADGTPQPIEKQPGNRLSIKDYMTKIRLLQKQQAAAGIPEDQRAVPTFGNVVGGSADIDQGEITNPDGSKEMVHGQINPEWVAGKAGEPLQRGPAHRVEQGRKHFSKAYGSDGRVNPFDPQAQDAIAYQQLPQTVQMYEQKTLKGQRHATPEEINAIGMSLRKEAGKIIQAEQKQFKELYGKDLDAKTAFDMWAAGNLEGAMAARQKAMDRKKMDKVYDDLYKKALDIQGKPDDMGNVQELKDPATGKVFQSPDEYARYYTQQYVKGLNDMITSLGNHAQRGGKPQTAEGKPGDASAMPQTAEGKPSDLKQKPEPAAGKGPVKGQMGSNLPGNAGVSSQLMDGKPHKAPDGRTYVWKNNQWNIVE